MNMNAEKRSCQNCKTEFVIESEDFIFYEKLKVPSPTFCFDCRLQRKLAFINERTLYKRKCDNCNQSMISMYSPKSQYKIFCTPCYNNREDCLNYGIKYNFSKPFFYQFHDLFKQVPRLHLMHKNNNGERCEYANYTYKSSNVYLSFTVVRSENIYYSKQVFGGNKICIDGLNIKDSERMYEVLDTSRSYNSRFLLRSARCIDSAYLFDCVECNNCFMSYNLRNKSYVFRNKQLSREEYLRKTKGLSLDSFELQEKLKKEFSELLPKAICRPAMTRSVENCTGDFIGHSKNTHYSFSNIDSEDSKYIVFGVNTIKDSYDLVFSGRSEFCYESVGTGAENNMVSFGLDVGANYNASYCISVNNSHDCFGCIGINNKSYCIFNKQYTKEEYEKLLPKIIKHMEEIPYVNQEGIIYKYGEFFPTEFSPFAYNESLLRGISNV